MTTNNVKKVLKLKTLYLSTLLATVPTLGIAQTQLEEIVVTARKSAETLQTTPVAVSAISEEIMVQKQLLQMVDLQRSAPSLSLNTGGTGPASILYASIRGQAQNSPNSVTDAAVGVYVDGVYLGRPIGSNLGFLDVGQVEVLRGPQGTLFGRNTTGGAITVTTNRPDTAAFGGHVKAEVGNYNLRHIETVLNVPINDELATRFAYRWNERDGYIDNPFYSEDFKDVDEAYSARGSVLWTPTDTPVEVFFSIDHEYYKDNGTPTTVIAYNDDARAASFLPNVAQLFASVGYNPRDFEGQFDKTFGFVQTAVLDDELMTPSNYTRATGATLDFQVEMGEATLRSITAYRESVSSNQNDLDGSPVDIISFFSEYGNRQWSQEVQLSGNLTDNLYLVGGLYHFEESGYEFSHAHQFGVFIQNFIAMGIVPPFSYRNTFSNYSAKSQGAFVQANYDLTDKLRLTAGYRYTQDERNIVRAPESNYIPQPGLPVSCGLTAAELGFDPTGFPLSACQIRAGEDFGYPAYVVSLDYQLNDDIFVYAKHSRASMAGSLNTREVPAPFSFAVDPETVQDIEVGMKADLLDDRLRANVAAFYMEGEDVQRIINAFNSAGTGLTQFNTNTGDTEIQGLELELTAIPWDGMEINFSAAVLDGEYVSGSFTEERFDSQGNVVTVDRSNEEIPRLPELTYSIGATQRFNLDIGELTAHLDYSYIDDQALVTVTGTPDPNPVIDAQNRADAKFVNDNATIDGYGLLNARLALQLNSPDVEIALWGRNLTDEEYNTNVFESWTALGFLLHNQGNPRTYGASVTYRF
ncbi:MAG: hypothetical protein CMK32_16435 [Porticoccaceae bacterium]|nr:hypothetical protein [Porticoccaceae bacterium]